MVGTPQAYQAIAGDMEAEAKANQKKADIPSYDAFEAFVGRAKPRLRR
jgi:hypothetical protein